MSKLKSAPTVDRFDSAPNKEGKSKVDREGGRYGAGVIHDVSLCSRGEALGHYMWVDQVMLQQIVDLSPTGPKFLKSRFTHPDMCSDGMGKGLGTIDGLRLEGDQVYGDLHFYNNAHDGPEGDLAGYVMNYAEEDPINFGLSIVFSHDWEAEDEFEDEHTQLLELKDDKGNVVSTRRQFQSPDDQNIENLPHARISAMRACDVVDDPAANPNGLFHRENALLADGGKLVEFVLGRSDEVPKLASSLGADVAPERLKSFVSKYLAKAGLKITEEGVMPATKSKLAEDDKKDEKKDDAPAPAEKKKDDAPPPADTEDGCDDEDSAKKEECSAKPDAELSEYCAAFGHEEGAKFFLAGKSFKAAQTEHIASLTAKNKELEEKVAAFATSGVEPVGFTAGKDPQRDKSNKSESTSAGEGAVDNREAFAALNKETVEKK